MTNKTFASALTIFSILRYYLVGQMGLGEIALPIVKIWLDLSIIILASYNVFFRKYIMDYIDNSYPERGYYWHRFLGDELDIAGDGKFKWVPKDTVGKYEFDEAIELLKTESIISENEVANSGFRCAITGHIMQLPVRILRACDIDEAGQLKIDWKSTEAVHRFDAKAIVDWLLTGKPNNPLNPDQPLRINYQEYGKQLDYKVGDVVPDLEQQDAIVDYICEKRAILAQQQSMMSTDKETVNAVASSSYAKSLYNTFTSRLRATTRVDGVDDLSTLRQRRLQG